MSTRPAPFGAIFDWDGVIIDSASLHEQSWTRLAAEIGKELGPESFMRGFGMKNERIIPEIHGWAIDPAEVRRLSLRKEALYRELVGEYGMVPLPGVAVWLQRLKEAEIPCVVASSTHRMNIDTILEKLGLTEAFDDIVSSEDVTHGKPDPEVFLRAATRINLSASYCVVFEDAHVGIEAARAAGMSVVAVTTTHPAKELTAADLVVDRLDQLSVESVVELIGNKREPQPLPTT